MDDIIKRLREPIHTADELEEYYRNGIRAADEIERLRAAMQEAIDLLAERKHGSPARSPGHNARLTLEAVLPARVL